VYQNARQLAALAVVDARLEVRRSRRAGCSGAKSDTLY
jgi:hypothetical protein